MNTIVYKYRQCFGIIEYEVLNGEFGVDSTLHLRDTSCTHSRSKCEIEVVKCDDGDCYCSKALNRSAEEYDYITRRSFGQTRRMRMLRVCILLLMAIEITLMMRRSESLRTTRS